MRLNAYLSEMNNKKGTKSRSKAITSEKAIELLRTNCKNALRSTPLYRGVDHRDPAMFIDPSKHVRRSQYTDNYYMLLFQLMTSWKDYPNLSQSIIGISYESDAVSWSEIGQAYRIFPYDGYAMGVCPQPHFWGSFYKHSASSTGSPIIGMDSLNTIILDLLEDYEIQSVRSTSTDPKVLLAAFDKIGKEADRSYVYHGPFKFGPDKEILDTFEEILAPNKNGFRLVNTSSTWEIPQRKQIWTEAPCVMINTDTDGHFEPELRKYL